jgi:hypothetical protein
MSVGDTTEDSVIWVPGESAGKDIYGETAALPVDADTGEIDTAIDALHDRLVASGVLPD